jgi:hypothetical protein
MLLKMRIECHRHVRSIRPMAVGHYPAAWSDPVGTRILALQKFGAGFATNWKINLS